MQKARQDYEKANEKMKVAGQKISDTVENLKESGALDAFEEV